MNWQLLLSIVLNAFLHEVCQLRFKHLDFDLHILKVIGYVVYPLVEVVSRFIHGHGSSVIARTPSSSIFVVTLATRSSMHELL